jgi:hypothetical protein
MRVSHIFNVLYLLLRAIRTVLYVHEVVHGSLEAQWKLRRRVGQLGKMGRKTYVQL